MSNTYSATSTLEDDEAPRRFPWRVMLVLSLLLATAIYSGQILMPAVRQYHADLLNTYFYSSGYVAEDVEQQLLPDEPADPQELADIISPLFDMDESPAFVRIWNMQGQLLCEVTSTAPTTSHTAADSTLNDLGLQAVLSRAQAHLDDTKWLAMAGRLQQVETAEGTLRDNLAEAEKQAAAGKQGGEASRGSFYSRQETLLAMTEGLQQDFPLLKDAVAGMNDALDALRNEADEAQAYSRAFHDAEVAQSTVTLVFEQFRAVDTGKVELPADLTSHAPLPASWPARLLPFVRGQRVLIPLLSPAANDELVAPAGTAEIVFYHRPAELIAALGVKLILPAALLLATLGILVIRRRKPQIPTSPSEPEPAKAPVAAD